jgi:hypothetical protein
MYVIYSSVFLIFVRIAQIMDKYVSLIDEKRKMAKGLPFEINL